MSVWYLDTDDEITDAVARLRAATDARVVLVVPPGSRIATGRINFRLLAREAASRDLLLAIVSPDGQVRALATAAGLLARAGVAEAEAALERGETVPEPEPPSTAPTDEAEDEIGLAADGQETVEGAVAPLPATRRRKRRWIVAGVAVAALAMGGLAAVNVLPTARITIRPTTSPIGPIAVAVTADPEAAAVDTGQGIVPARVIEIPLSVSGVFRSSGSEVAEARATGEVRFSSASAPFEAEIPPRTRVSTTGDAEFETTRGVRLEAATDGSGSWTAMAPIQAVLPGPEGNVASGTITVVPSLESQGISVLNPQATTGGTSDEIPVVTQDDYDAAVVDLRNRLTGQLAARLDDEGVAPEGLTLFPGTASRGTAVSLPQATDLVGQRTAEFDLGSEVVATVLAVDEALVTDLAAQRLVSQVPDGSVLLPSSVQAEPGLGTPGGGLIRYAAIVSGDTYQVIDPAQLVQLVRGKPVSDARSILAPFGRTDISLWPEFLGTLPDDPGRIELSIREPGTEEQ